MFAELNGGAIVNRDIVGCCDGANSGDSVPELYQRLVRIPWGFEALTVGLQFGVLHYPIFCVEVFKDCQCCNVGISHSWVLEGGNEHLRYCRDDELFQAVDHIGVAGVVT